MSSTIDFAALRREREARHGAPPPAAAEDSSEEPAAKEVAELEDSANREAAEAVPKRPKLSPPAGASIVELLDSDDDEDVGVNADEALARRLQREEYTTTARGGASSSSSTSMYANPLGLDFSRVEILRADPTPVVLFRAAGGRLGELASSLADFNISKDRRSNRKCGAAENSGINGKNCDNTFHPLADTNTIFDDKCRQITMAQSQSWVRGVVQPVMAAAAEALGRGSQSRSSARQQLVEVGEIAPFATAELRVLQYDAPVRKEKKEGHLFHRHLDHGMYGWVVLVSLYAECDFYVRLGKRPEPPTCECGLPCKLARVAKDGANIGRFYFCCRGQYNACKSFEWAREGKEVPSSERVLRLGHGDLLIFDASRQSDVEHGVDAIYRNCNGDGDGARSYRVSVQWRVSKNDISARMVLAWMAKNLADFDDADVTEAIDTLKPQPRPQAVSGPSRVAAVQALIDCTANSEGRRGMLKALVRRVCEAERNRNRFLARRLVGGGRNMIETCAHIDPDIFEACFRDTVRVPASPRAAGPLRGVVRLPPLSRLGMKAL